MEELLNKLIQRGWKPFGIEGIKEFHLKAYECERGTNKIMIKHFEGFFTDGIKTSDHQGDIGTRMYVVYGLKHITAKESGLRQFCVENNLVNKYADISDEEEAYIGKWKSGLDAIDIYGDYIRLDDDYDEYHQDTDYKYWLIESALKDEEYLEKFLLDNIKVDGE